MTSRLSWVVIDATDPTALAVFWKEVPGSVVAEEDDTGMSLAAPGTRMPTLDILRVPEAKAGKNRLHLDLRAEGLTTVRGLERAFALGARRVETSTDPNESDGPPRGHLNLDDDVVAAGAVRSRPLWVPSPKTTDPEA
jgi:hypothetical protein